MPLRFPLRSRKRSSSVVAHVVVDGPALKSPQSRTLCTASSTGPGTFLRGLPQNQVSTQAGQLQPPTPTRTRTRNGHRNAGVAGLLAHYACALRCAPNMGTKCIQGLDPKGPEAIAESEEAQQPHPKHSAADYLDGNTMGTMNVSGPYTNGGSFAVTPLQILDTDTHISEGPRTWVDRLPAKWGDKVMHLRVGAQSGEGDVVHWRRPGEGRLGHGRLWRERWPGC